jgi:membrane associated rhomboid family serine protease
MVPAAVGYQCPHCVQQHTRRSRQNDGPFGGQLVANPKMTTYVLIGINLVVFGLIIATGWTNSPWIYRLALSPVDSFYLVDGHVAIAPGVASGAVWQLLTTMFTHVQLMHIGMNLLTLWFLGPTLEQVLGRARFLALYLLSGLTGSVTVLWFSDPNSVTLGASTCLFGLIAALIIVLRKLGRDFRQILMWLVLNIIVTLLWSQHISWQGHLGGLVGGLAISFILVSMPREHRARNQWLALSGYGLVLAGLAAARIVALA